MPSSEIPAVASEDFTGERFLPSVGGEIYCEHMHRYAFAEALVADKSVLDVASGEGYGAALLARSAALVVGVDVAVPAASGAQARYGASRNLHYVAGSAAQLPLRSASFDAVVSFETIEHLPQNLQRPMIEEFARTLADDGLLILSSPNRAVYSDARNYRNQFHLHELYRDELAALLAVHFPHQHWYRQRLQHWSALWAEEPGSRTFQAISDETGRPGPASVPDAMYFLVIAAKRHGALPGRNVDLSLFRDAAGAVEAKAESDAREILRLDALLKSRDQSLDRQMEHIQHLERLVAYRDRIIEERDRQLAELNTALAAERADSGVAEPSPEPAAAAESRESAGLVSRTLRKLFSSGR